MSRLNYGEPNGLMNKGYYRSLVDANDLQDASYDSYI